MLGLKSVVGLEDHNSSSLAVERILPINIMQEVAGSIPASEEFFLLPCFCGSKPLVRLATPAGQGCLNSPAQRSHWLSLSENNS